MLHTAFLMAMSQLAVHKKARISLEDKEIFIEAGAKDNRWKLCTKIFNGNGFLPERIRDCISASGVLKWQKEGAFLKLDPETHSVYLVQELELAFKYIFFKQIVTDFIKVAEEWRQILKGIPENDKASI